MLFSLEQNLFIFLGCYKLSTDNTARINILSIDNTTRISITFLPKSTLISDLNPSRSSQVALTIYMPRLRVFRKCNWCQTEGKITDITQGRWPKSAIIVQLFAFLRLLYLLLNSSMVIVYWCRLEVHVHYQLCWLTQIPKTPHTYSGQSKACPQLKKAEHKDQLSSIFTFK